MMMKKFSKFSVLLAVAISSVLFLAGCFKTTQRNSLENVNKDWNQLIRASHIYPIYPLNQDVQPGDVFLTETDINDADFGKNRKGFLPLDQHIARVYPTGYVAFYTNTSVINSTNRLPLVYLSDNSWTNALAAAFPTYSFTVEQGGGASVSLPIQGIPVGLSLMGARKASGFVTIADSHTYGIDELSMRDQVQGFAEANALKIIAALPARNGANGKNAPGKTGRDAAPEKEAAPPGGTNRVDSDNEKVKDGEDTYYLQVVTRVFTTGRVAVSLNNDDAIGGSLTAGAPKEVPLSSLETTNAATNYAALVSSVNTVLASNQLTGMLPGGALKFARVSSRSVSLQETFPKPVVIGYLGFCLAVTKQSLLDLASKASKIDRLGTMLETDAGVALTAITNQAGEITRELQPDKLQNYTNALQALSVALDQKRSFSRRLTARDTAVRNLEEIQTSIGTNASIRTNLEASLHELKMLPDDARKVEQQGQLETLSLRQLEKRVSKK